MFTAPKSETLIGGSKLIETTFKIPEKSIETIFFEMQQLFLIYKS
jgi:hypothetical protein